VSEILCVRLVQSHPPLVKTVSAYIVTQGHDMCLLSFLGSIKAPVPSSDLPLSRRPRAGHVKSVVFGGTGATRSPLEGEHGEDPRFARPGRAPRAGRMSWRNTQSRHIRGRLNRGDGVQIELDHVLKCDRRGAVAQTFGQGFEQAHIRPGPRSSRPARRSSASTGFAAPPPAFDDKPRLSASILAR